MVAAKQHLIYLLALPEPWAAQSGLPSQTVLRRLTEWTMCGAFPPEVFRTAADIPVDPFDIYMSFRALSETSGFGGGIHLGGTTYSAGRWGIDILGSALISSSAIEQFCEKADVEPPWQRYVSFWGFQRKAARRQHLAPPPCPEAEDCAIRYDAGRSAEASMNSMESLLGLLLGKPRPHYPAIFDGGPIDLNYWGTRWADHRAYALSSIEISQNEHARGRLDRLDDEWEKFVQSHVLEQKCSAVATQVIATMSLCKSERLARFKGVEFVLPERPFQLLYLLSERSKLGKPVVSVREIESHLWGDQLHKMKRQVSDVVRELRDILDKVPESSGRALIHTLHKQGYRLELPPTAILLDP